MQTDRFSPFTQCKWKWGNERKEKERETDSEDTEKSEKKVKKELENIFVVIHFECEVNFRSLVPPLKTVNCSGGIQFQRPSSLPSFVASASFVIWVQQSAFKGVYAKQLYETRLKEEGW